MIGRSTAMGNVVWDAVSDPITGAITTRVAAWRGNMSFFYHVPAAELSMECEPGGTGGVSVAFHVSRVGREISEWSPAVPSEVTVKWRTSDTPSQSAIWHVGRLHTYSASGSSGTSSYSLTATPGDESEARSFLSAIHGSDEVVIRLEVGENQDTVGFDLDGFFDSPVAPNLEGCPITAGWRL